MAGLPDDLERLARSRHELHALQMAASPRRRVWMLFAGALCGLTFVLGLGALLFGSGDGRDPTAMLVLSLFFLVVALWQWESRMLFRLLLRLAEQPERVRR